MENSEMQVLRWGIPGWVTILTYMALSVSARGYDVNKLINPEGSLLSVGSVALLVAIGIPLGYIIYQIYFYVKWTCFVDDEKIDNLMRGIKLYEELPKNREMNSLDNWKKAERTFNIYLSAYIEDTRLRYDDIMRQYQSFKSRTDRVHGLGASFSGIILAILVFIIFNGLEVFKSCSFIITLLLVLVTVYILFSNYKRADSDSFAQMKGIIVDIEVARKIMKKK